LTAAPRCISIRTIIFPQEPAPSAANASFERTWMRRRITLLNILIAHTHTHLHSLQHFRDLHNSFVRATYQECASSLRAFCLPHSLCRNTFTAQRRDKGKKNCSPIQKQIVSILLLAASLLQPQFLKKKMRFLFAERCRFAPWSRGLQPPP
jgi:hypothetical protein